MDEISLSKRALSWLIHLPIVVAYRMIWLTAKLGSRNARDVHQAMWDANLSIPPLAKEPGHGG